MPKLSAKIVMERLFSGVLALSFLVTCLVAYQLYGSKVSLLLPAQATSTVVIAPFSTAIANTPTLPKQPVFIEGVAGERAWLAKAEATDDVQQTKFKTTGLGTPLFDVRRRMSVLAYEAHDKKLPTPGGLGSYGCAVAIWHHVIRPALLEAYPEKAKLIPVQLQHTQQILNFYSKYKLGSIKHIPAFDLTPDKTPPGSVIIGIKKGSRGEHMLVAVDVNWGSTKNPKTGTVVPLKRDGKTDAYAGNTGLKQFGKPHFRIQEFAPHIGFLNEHHGAINSLNKNNYYEEFVVLTF